MKVVIDTQREPVYEHGRLVGHYVHTYTVDRPDVSKKTPRPVTMQAAPTPRQQAVSPPQPTTGFQLECFIAPDTLGEVVKIQQARREGKIYVSPQLPAAPLVPAASWYTPAPDTLRLVVERQRARAQG